MATTSARRAFLMLALAAGVCGAARPALAADVEGHIENSALMGFNLGQLKIRFTIGGDVSTWWSPRSGFQIGVQTGLAITTIPYGDSSDGAAPIGKLGQDADGRINVTATLMPRAMFGARIPLWRTGTLGAFVGPTFIIAPEMGAHAAIPYPTASVALDSGFGRRGRFGLRAAFSYIQFVYGDTSRVILAPSLAFSWR